MALESLDRARVARETLIKANPAVTRNREQIIRVHRQSADIHRRAGRMPQVLESLEQVSQVAASLVELHPQNQAYRDDLVNSYFDLGDLYSTMGKLAETRSSFDSALAITRRSGDTKPSTDSNKGNLAQVLRRRALAMQRCGVPADAASDLRQCITSMRELTKPTLWDHYNVACYHSLLAGIAAQPGSGLTADQGKIASDEAMKSLRRAVAMGQRDAAWMKTDTDLDPLRSRHDFQLMLMDLELPTDPFAGSKATP